MPTHRETGYGNKDITAGCPRGIAGMVVALCALLVIGGCGDPDIAARWDAMRIADMESDHIVKAIEDHLADPVVPIPKEVLLTEWLAAASEVLVAPTPGRSAVVFATPVNDRLVAHRCDLEQRTSEIIADWARPGGAAPVMAVLPDSGQATRIGWVDQLQAERKLHIVSASHRDQEVGVASLPLPAFPAEFEHIELAYIDAYMWGDARGGVNLAVARAVPDAVVQVSRLEPDSETWSTTAASVEHAVFVPRGVGDSPDNYRVFCIDEGVLSELDLDTGKVDQIARTLGLFARYEVLADHQDRAHLVFWKRRADDNVVLTHATEVQDEWREVDIVDLGPLPSRPGRPREAISPDMFQLAAHLSQEDDLHVVYFDVRQQALCYATNASGDWVTEVIARTPAVSAVSIRVNGDEVLVAWGDVGRRAFMLARASVSSELAQPDSGRRMLQSAVPRHGFASIRRMHAEMRCGAGE